MKFIQYVSASMVAAVLTLAPAAMAKDNDRDEHRRFEQRHDDHRRMEHERREHRNEWVRDHRNDRRRDWERERRQREAMHRYDREHHGNYAHTVKHEPRRNGWDNGKKTGWDGRGVPPSQTHNEHTGYRPAPRVVQQRSAGPVVVSRPARRDDRDGRPVAR